MAEYKPIDEQVWEYLRSYPAATAETIASAMSIDIGYVRSAMSKIGTPLEVRTGKPERIRLLEDAIVLTGGDRNKAYGPPFDNWDATAQLVSAYISAKRGGETIAETFRLTAEDMAHIMQLVKIARTFHGAYRPDNYTDNSAYGAIAGECRRHEEERG